MPVNKGIAFFSPSIDDTSAPTGGGINSAPNDIRPMFTALPKTSPPNIARELKIIDFILTPPS
jgi:hypothetical protein